MMLFRYTRSPNGSRTEPKPRDAREDAMIREAKREARRIERASVRVYKRLSFS